MEICIIGEIKLPKKDIEKKIKAMGGKIASQIHDGLAAVISTAKDVNRAYDDDLREAFMRGIQVVPEEFLEEVIMCDDPIQLIVRMDMSNRGKDPYERMPNRKKPDESAVVKPNKNAKNTNCDANQLYTADTNVYSDNGLKYSAMLSLVDIGANKNSYFKLQLLNSFNLVESKGRIGTKIGSTQQKHYSNIAEAQKVFGKIYLEMTGNEFGAQKFVKKPGKYYHVKIDNAILSQKIRPNSAPTKLTEPLHQLMQLLFDENVMKSTLLEFYFDLHTMPLGIVCKKQIQDAIDHLIWMSSMLGQPNVTASHILAASNQIYSYFPHDFGVQRPAILNTHEMLQEKVKVLQHLLQKGYTYDLLTSELNEERNLLDVCYEHLKDSAEITMLNKLSGMYAQICSYVANTQLGMNAQNGPQAFEVVEIFQVARHEEIIRYAPYEQNFNRQLLFHGSSVRNFVSILTNGLKIAPPEAHFHGSIFGKGIYFSDSVSKAASYCHVSNGTGLVLLCEVAVGISDIRYRKDSSKLIDYCESIQAIGQYYPHPLHVRHDGLKIPNGQLTRRPEQTGNTFNEFVVFDESRVKIQYIVKLKFSSR